MRLTKKQRESVRGKFGGRCAYCGCELSSRWHADHFEPVMRNAGSYWSGLPMMYMDRDCIGNMMPSCAPCNISKGAMSLEEWRGWLERHVESLNKHHSIYRLAKAFGLIYETGAQVTFHFEKCNQEVSTNG
jgi:hypothetical protein